MKILVVLFFTVFSCFAQDEGEPQSLAEAKAEFAKADKALNAAYAETKAAIPEYEFEQLREEQRDWLEYRDARALMAIQFDHREIEEGKEKQSPHYWGWLADLSETRIKILRGWLGVGDPDSWSGYYIDGHGGHIRIVQKGDKLHFEIEVVRGPTYHLGWIGGVADVNKRIARFSDAGSDATREDETWITFLSKNRRLRVIGANTKYYHGARAFFDGEYIRVEVLDEKTATELVNRKGVREE